MTRPLKFRLWRYSHALKAHKHYYLSGAQIAQYDNDLVFTLPDGSGAARQYCDSAIHDPEDGCLIQQWTGFVDRNGLDIYEGDKVNFSTRGHTHGPEREDYKDMEVYWDQAAGCWLFDRTLSFQMMDGIMPETLEVVSSA